MNKTEILYKLQALLSEISENPIFISYSTDLINDITLDSLGMIRFILEIEGEFNIQLDIETFDFSLLEKVERLVEHIQGKISYVE